MGHTEPGETQNACGDTTIGERAYDFSRYVSLKQEKDCHLDRKLLPLQGSQ